MTTAAVQAQPETAVQCGWAKRAGFRFAFVYLLLNCLPSMGTVSLAAGVPGGYYIAKPFEAMWRAVLPWVATRVFGVTGAAAKFIENNGSGDTTLNYVQVFCWLVFSAVAAAVWTALDRRRPNYSVLYDWLYLIVRFTLAFTMLAYGLAKVIPMQMPAPGPARLIEPLGDFSPMGVLWTFMGVSPAYESFCGLAETTGGVLLLFRRTAFLGALVSGAALTNVVMLNFCYDVPVKIYSTHLLMLAAFLALPSLRALGGLLVLNRDAAPARVPGPCFTRRWLRAGAICLAVGLSGYFVYSSLKEELEFYRTVAKAPSAPVYGVYDVESFQRNGQEVPPSITDSTRWRKIAFGMFPTMRVRMMDDTGLSFAGEIDDRSRAVTVFDRSKPSDKSKFTYFQPDTSHLLLAGKFGQDTVQARLRKVEMSKFLLISRGFHWINETPFNR
jgi:hypothetical protein